MKALLIISRRLLQAMIFTAIWSKSFGQVPTNASPEATFRTTESIELHSGERLGKDCIIQIIYDNSLTLTCGDEQIKLTIVGQRGTWREKGSKSEIVYDVSYQEELGKITIERLRGSLSVLIDFTQSAKDGMKRKFLISSYE